MYHFVYKTTNIVNGRIYIGVHSTDNINDGYLGSGVNIKKSIKKYGKNNFRKEIIEFFDSRDKAEGFERQIVTSNFILEKSNYNMTEGGKIPPIRSGESHPLYGVKRPDSSARMISNNPAKLDHVREYTRNTRIIINDITGEGKRVLKSDEIPSGWSTVNKGKVTVKDGDGKIFSVSVNDPRYKSGALVPASRGSKRSYSIESIKNITSDEKMKKLRDGHKKYMDELNQSSVECPHCGKIGKMSGMRRWHFDRCKGNVICE